MWGPASSVPPGNPPCDAAFGCLADRPAGHERDAARLGKPGGGRSAGLVLGGDGGARPVVNVGRGGDASIDVSGADVILAKAGVDLRLADAQRVRDRGDQAVVGGGLRVAVPALDGLLDLRAVDEPDVAALGYGAVVVGGVLC